MKTALIKQAQELHGPWSSVLWQQTSPEKLLEIWPWKATYWEMTCLLEADWYVISENVPTFHNRRLFSEHPEFLKSLEHVDNTVSIEEIPFDEYDLIITFDPVIRRVPHTKALMAYFLNEHNDPLYKQSQRKVVWGYDLFLAHMIDGPATLTGLPQAISFPYLRAPKVARAIFNEEKEEAVWADWRTLTTLGMTDYLEDKSAAITQRLEEYLHVPVRHGSQLFTTFYGVHDKPRWGDPALFLQKLSRCKYYVGVGRAGGAGQGLCDAASLGLICFGEKNKVFHRLTCHPACLCEDMVELPIKVKKVLQSSDLQAEILDWQDRALREHFVERPREILVESIALKHKVLT